MKRFLLLININLFVIKIFCKDAQTFFVRDFLLRQSMPTKVNAILCWPNDEKIHLLRTLSENNYFVTFLSLDAELLPRPFPDERQMFLMDLCCENWESILIKAETMKLFRHPYRWLVFGDYETFFVNLDITIDSRFYIARDVNNGCYNLESVYKITPDFDLLSNNIGRWEKSQGFLYFNELVVSKNRTDLMGISLNISMVLSDLDSLNHMWDYKHTHTDPSPKANNIYLTHLADMLNASKTYTYQKVWGEKNQITGEFTGMIGDLQRGEAEIGGIVSFITHERIPVIDYISPTTPTRAKFIFRAPPLSYVTNIFTLPFERWVWLSFFALTAVTALVIYIIVFWEWKNPDYLQRDDLQQVTRLRANFFDSLMVQVGGICQQGSDTEPRSSAGRIALIFSFIALMFLYTSFSANIVALLQTSSDSIKTIEDLLYSNIKAGSDDTPYARYFFAVENETTRKALYQEKIAPKGQEPNFMSIEEGIAKMRQDFFAFHVELGAGYKVVVDTFQEHEKCGITEISFLQEAEPWLPMRKNSSYNEIIKVALRKIHESGIRNRELFRFFPTKPICSGQGSTFVSVGLIDCYYGFLIFGVGIGCSAFLLVLEVLTAKYFKKHSGN